MKGIFLILVVCAVSALSKSIPPKPLRPVFAGKVRNPRIVGGEEAVPHSIPYQVGLFLGDYFCGGSLISPRHVVTAAHCGELTKKPQVVLGAHEIQGTEPTQVILTGVYVWIHPKWDPFSLRNDISIIELPEDVTLNDNIQTISWAPSSSGDFAGEIATASGWGLAFDGSTSISPVLRVVNSTVLSLEDCRTAFGAGIAVFDSVICIDGSEGKSTCNGDSGGPLTVDVNNQKVQIGLTSYGVSLGCEVGYPAAFTRLSSFDDWIKNIVSIA